MNELILERKQGTYVSSNSFTFFWSFAVLTVTCVIFSQSGSCFVGETVQPRVFLCFIRYSPSRFCISFIKKATVYSTQYNIGHIIPPGNRSMRKCTRKHGKRQRAKRLLNFIQLKQVCECSTTRKLARVLSSWLVLCCFTSADASLSDVRSLSLLVLKTKALFYHLLKKPKRGWEKIQLLHKAKQKLASALHYYPSFHSVKTVVPLTLLPRKWNQKYERSRALLR